MLHILFYAYYVVKKYSILDTEFVFVVSETSVDNAILYTCVNLRSLYLFIKTTKNTRWWS